VLYCEEICFISNSVGACNALSFDFHTDQPEVIPMSISKEQVHQVAHLARLKLNEQEAEQFTHQLNQILEFAAKLNELDTEHVEPTSHVLPLSNVLRDDRVVPSIAREKALQNAQEQQDGMFKVPAVFEE